LKDLKNEEALFQSKKKRRALREAAMQEDAQTPVRDEQEKAQDGLPKQKVESLGGVKFY